MISEQVLESLRANGFFDKWAALTPALTAGLGKMMGGGLTRALGHMAKARGPVRMVSGKPMSMGLPRARPGMFELPQSKSMAKVMNPTGAGRQMGEMMKTHASLEGLGAKLANVMREMQKGLQPSRKAVAIEPIRPPKVAKVQLPKADLVKGLKPPKVGSVDQMLLSGFSGAVDRWLGRAA